MGPGCAIERDERRFEQKECLEHQDVAVALGLRGAWPGRWFKQGVEIRETESHPEAIPLKYTGDKCPLCSPRETMMEGVRKITTTYREARSLSGKLPPPWDE